MRVTHIVTRMDVTYTVSFFAMFINVTTFDVIRVILLQKTRAKIAKILMTVESFVVNQN